jgi:GcrA cell cycle regulator
MCRLTGRHDLTILVAIAPAVNTSKSALVPTSSTSEREYVEARWTTLAPDSRHIVAFGLFATTSRAADSSSKALVKVLRVGRRALPGLMADSAKAAPANFEEGLTMSWTDERVEQLKKLWADGLSASQIAAELGGITRNAVIGKVHRLGLSGRAKSASSAAPRPRKPRSATHMLRIGRGSIRGNTALAHAYEIDAEPEPELIDNIIPIGQRRTILELNEQTCHWPVGDPGSSDFFFCGGNTLTGLPYCAYHCRVAYQPASDRRRDRRPAR